MSKRCRQCGRSIGDNEGDFCSSGCHHQFERENPGQLKHESKMQGCVVAIVAAIVIIGAIILKLSGKW